jgi:uncharacterized protein YlxW (UPF0749 family)
VSAKKKKPKGPGRPESPSAAQPEVMAQQEGTEVAPGIEAVATRRTVRTPEVVGTPEPVGTESAHDDSAVTESAEPSSEPPVDGTEPVVSATAPASDPVPAAEPWHARHSKQTDDESEPVDDTQPYPGRPGPVPTSRRAWRRLVRAGRPRATKANVLATLLAIGLGFAIAAQVRQTSIEGLEDLREDELIRILDTVDQDGNRLAEEIQTLRFSRDRLQSDTTSLTEARTAAQQRLDSLAILTGTAPARGPGIVLTIRDPEFGVTAPMLLDTLQELRDAGAEAVEINDVRIVANTYFTDGEGGISISGKDVSAPYVITAIGDGSTLASAMEIPGGVTNTVRSVGGEAVVETKDEVTVSALQSVSEPQYARPIPSPTKS